ncbi:MAG: hypothetical protein EWM73_01971 [Nitrospira sp.]|nr:MAG: hypothetical protein EWM73_01971 [Nitrospira sp.]
MNRAGPSSQRKQTACSGCHLTRDHSAATTRGVGVISPTRAVIRGTPSPLWLHYTENHGLQEMICATAAPIGLTIGTRKEARVRDKPGLSGLSGVCLVTLVCLVYLVEQD